MELKIRLEINDSSMCNSDIHEPYTDNMNLDFEDLDSEQLWMAESDIEARVGKDYLRYDILNPITKNWTSYIRWDDTYGEVDYYIHVSQLTVEQLIKHFQTSDGYVMILAQDGGIGGGDDILNILELVKNGIKLIDQFASQHPFIFEFGCFSLFWSYRYVRKVFERKKYSHIDAQTVLDYIYSEDKWEISRLKKSFNTNNVRALSMVLDFFGYERQGENFVQNKKVPNILARMEGFTLKDQYLILASYLETKKFGGTQEYIMYKVLNEIESDIDQEYLELIFKDFESMNTELLEFEEIE